jgi:hypothetical protein
MTDSTRRKIQDAMARYPADPERVRSALDFGIVTEANATLTARLRLNERTILSGRWDLDLIEPGMWSVRSGGQHGEEAGSLIVASLGGTAVYTAMPWGAGATTWDTPEEALDAFGDAS